MAHRVILHIGAMKSGTSFIQSRLGRNRGALEAQGFLFPGKNWHQQVLAVTDVLQRQRIGVASREGKWQALVDEVAASSGTALISMEFLGPVGPKKIRAVLDSFPGVDVRVVLTVRDLNRCIPAMWQETLKNFRTWTLDEYVVAIRAADGPGKLFWREQDTPAMARRWVNAVGREQFTLVTVPGPDAGPELLWDRFASAVGLDPATCPPVPGANESLGAASALVLRRLNQMLEDGGMEFKDYVPLVKHGLAKNVLGAHKKNEPSVGLEVAPWVEDRARSIIEEFRELDVRVVGELSDLLPVEVRGVHPSAVSTEEQLQAAVAGLTGLIHARRRERRRRQAK